VRQPDLQGVWDFRTITPLERSEQLGTKAFFTAEEAAKYYGITVQKWKKISHQEMLNETGTDCCTIWGVLGVPMQAPKHARPEPRARLIAKTVKRIARFMFLSSFSRGGPYPKLL
jgi:hypothetical protein